MLNYKDLHLKLIHHIPNLKNKNMKSRKVGYGQKKLKVNIRKVDSEKIQFFLLWNIEVRLFTKN